MPARDIYHETVKQALMRAGWEITHDPLRLQWGMRDMYVDLGAEELLAADLAIFEEPVGQLLMQRYHLQLIVFHPEHAEILQWIPWRSIARSLIQQLAHPALIGSGKLRRRRLVIVDR